MEAIKLTTYEEQFALLKVYSNGGLVYRHPLVNLQAGDYFIVETIAHEKASQGSEVFILPTLDGQDHPLRAVIFDGAKPNKCPDLKVDGVFVEVKTPDSGLNYNKVNGNIAKAYKQANHVVINLIDHYCVKRLEDIANGRFKTHSSLEVIEYRVFGVYTRCERRA